MVRQSCACSVVVAALLLTSNLSAQDIFGGQGINGRSAEKPSVGKKLSDWFPKRSATSKPKLGMPKLKMPKFEMPKFEMPKMPALKKPGQGNNIFSGLGKRPSWLPKRDPNAPSLFEKLNRQSKDMAAQTSDWFKGKTDSLSDRGTASWDSIKREMQKIKQEQSQGRKGSLIRPNVRTARTLGSERR